jgi:hypothetical protein
MVEFLKITYLLFDGYVFPQIVSIAMGTDCAPLIADATQAPQKPRVNSATPERLAVPAPLVAPVALLLSKSSGKS